MLLGDAKATAHYSIGSGTKLAMEDSIGLLEALRATDNVADALQKYEELRRDDVGRLQHSAEVSLKWFEAMPLHWQLEPEQFAFGVMSRSKQVTYENLLAAGQQLHVEQVQNWYIARAREQGYQVADGTPPMFIPFKLRDHRAKKPSSHVAHGPIFSRVDGMPGEWHLVHLGSRALGGAGLLFTEMTCIAADGRITPGCAGLWNEAQATAWARIVDFVHQQSDAKVCLQLGHAGRKGSTKLAWEGIDQPLDDPTANWPLIAASSLPYIEGVSQLPAAMNETDMERVTAQFVRSAQLAEQAGFDMLELHMAHGYLLATFISPLTNIRQDEYGGDIAQRMRFPLRVYEAVRAVWPDHKPISVRVSATDWYEGGLSEADLLAMARILGDAGVDLIDVSSGQTVSYEEPVYGRMFQTPFADLIRQSTGLATMAVGNIHNADQVNTILLQGRADLVALARPHLNDAYFTNQAAAWYGYQGHAWPKQYWSGRNQAFLLAERERADYVRMRAALRPETHEVIEEDPT